jgi:3-dehydroquinate dehydratase / shikimate dehydrogenase
MTGICVSLTEPTTEATLARMASLQDVADLFEVRADCAPDLDLAAVLRARTRPILFTCRPRSEGGHWPDEDAPTRRRRLRSAVDQGVDFVDVELRSGFEDVIRTKAGNGLVLSSHDLQGIPDDLEGLDERMTSAGADVVKIVGTARSVTDLGRLLAFARRRAREGPLAAGAASPARPGLVALAMGPYGVPSRVLGGRHGAPFTYAAPEAGREAAPGQLPARTLLRTYRVRSVGPRTRTYGVLGTDVLRSLSPAIHNRAFAERGIDAVYVPLQAESLEAFFAALPELGLSGFSVTRPYKSDVVPLLSSITPLAAEAGSANTVVEREGRLVGLSTDGEGVLGPLTKRLDVTGRRIAVVGAGGAARAAVYALVRAGAKVTVFARRPEQARDVAAATGCSHAPLPLLAQHPFDVLVHATPAGSGAQPGELAAPVSPPPEAVVFDMVYEPRDTPLLRAARAAGCRTIDGVEMLVAQAVGQFEAWTGTSAPVEAMTDAALGALESVGGPDR